MNRQPKRSKEPAAIAVALLFGLSVCLWAGAVAMMYVSVSSQMEQNQAEQAAAAKPEPVGSALDAQAAVNSITAAQDLLGLAQALRTDWERGPMTNQVQLPPVAKKTGGDGHE
jgi:flagellar basal body-associated protein FliL